VVYGDGKRYLVGGVWVNEDAVRAHVGAAGTQDERGYRDARRTLVQQRIEKVNATLPSYQTIKHFALMSRPLTVEGGLLTPTLKVKRKRVYEAFREELEALYVKDQGP
jgi:long-chain acyl-CoA synthetase